jgi:hypothetical protein
MQSLTLVRQKSDRHGVCVLQRGVSCIVSKTSWVNESNCVREDDVDILYDQCENEIISGDYVVCKQADSDSDDDDDDDGDDDDDVVW